MHSASLGTQAPDFTLPDQNGKMHTLSAYQGGWVLLYFYPKDDTPGCTKEACTIRDSWSAFQKAGITVLGVSKDSIKSHAKFAEKYTLPFTILADEEKKVLELYGVWQEKKLYGRAYMGIVRWSFLIDPQGEIVRIYEGVKPADHAAEVLEDVGKM